MTTKISGDNGIIFPDATQQDTRGVPNDLPLVRVYSNTPQTFTSNTPRKMTFEGVNFDTHSAWSTVNNRYSPPVAGWYLVIGAVRFDGSASDNKILQIYKNGLAVTHGIQFNETNMV